MSRAETPIVVALDVANANDCLQLLDVLDPDLCRVKVGLELFTRAGPTIVKTIQQRDFDVFLDLKFHDIPNTVARSCAAAADMGVWMMNVHASGGRRMLEAARAAVPASASTKLIAVTVLTSMDEAELNEVNVERQPEQQVASLATLVHECELDGVVCSALEAEKLRRRFGSDYLLVTPGIRPAGSEVDDQRRIITPAEAVKAGSDFLVIGRPITKAPDPVAALRAICSELAG